MANRMMRPGVELIGVPTNSSGTTDGVARAPAALRARGLVAALTSEPGLTDAGDIPLESPQPCRGPSGLLAEDALITMVERVGAAVAAARSAGRLPLLIGGDCPVILGALAALQAEAAQPGLLFVDGHEDAWPPSASPTGEAADCELGLMLGLFDADLDPRLRAALPRMRAEHVVAVGPRDDEELAAAGIATLDGQLRALIRPAEIAGTRRGAAGATVTPVVARTTVAARDAATAAAALLPAPWWLHVDLDVLEAASLAAVDYRQPGGLSWAQLTQFTSAALAADGCAGWSVCIYNPDLDPDRRGADDIVRYIGQAIRNEPG